MVRHRKLGLFAVLALMLALVAGLAAPVHAAEQHEVQIRASYQAMLEVTWPGNVDLGPIAQLPYNSGDLLLTFTVNSNLPFETALEIRDYSSEGLMLGNPYVFLMYAKPGEAVFTSLDEGGYAPVWTGIEWREGTPPEPLEFQPTVAIEIVPEFAIEPGIFHVGLLFTVSQMA
jgi:hypothetical protein